MKSPLDLATANRSRTVAANITELDQKTRENDDALGHVLEGAKRLLAYAVELREQVISFLLHVRAV